MEEERHHRHSPAKREERDLLDQLIRLYPGFPSGRIKPAESPDFIILTGRKRRTGIELTRLTRSGKMLLSGAERFHPEFSLEALEQLIRMKEAKTGLYRKKRLDRIWLVIVVEAFDVPPAFNIRNHMDHWCPDTPFQAVLILDLSLQSVYEIKPPRD